LLLLQCCCFLCFHRLRLEPQHCKKFPPPLLTLSSFPIPLISCLIVSFFFSPWVFFRRLFGKTNFHVVVVDSFECAAAASGASVAATASLQV
jgi:hypothetical protein